MNRSLLLSLLALSLLFVLPACDVGDDDVGDDDDDLGADDDDGVPDGLDEDGDNWATPLDCDDSNPNSHPGAPELCDGEDNDCDGAVDGVGEVDADNDSVMVCEGDCDDDDPDTFPGATDIPDDGIDQDCVGGDAISICNRATVRASDYSWSQFVEEISDCSAIPGQLNIGELLYDWPVTDLSFLSNLQEVGQLNIRYTDTLLTLGGLENLHTARSIYINSNDALVSVCALAGITVGSPSSNTSLHMSGNEALCQSEVDCLLNSINIVSGGAEPWVSSWPPPPDC
jgi:hypothetical protein